MPLLLLIAFVVVPLVELAVIQQVAAVVDLGPTLVLLLLDSVLGAWLVRREGSRAWQALRDAMSQGRIPGDEITQGAMVLFGGALLLTPGFVTDVVGLLLVLPPTRAAASRALRHRIVPEPLQEGASVWNGVRVRRADDAGRGGEARRVRGSRGADGSADRGRGGAPPPVEDVEVLSVEREADRDGDR